MSDKTGEAPMDSIDPIAQVKALREKWADVAILREKWEMSRIYCVAPKDVRIPLHLLVIAAQNARTPEEAQEYVQKIKNILEWIGPTNTRQQFDVFEHGDVRVEIPKTPEL
jgi:hypothetical protein